LLPILDLFKHSLRDKERLVPIALFAIRNSINNVGASYINNNYGVNSDMVEYPVLNFVVTLFHAADNAPWGYIASGGTEANMYG